MRKTLFFMAILLFSNIVIAKNNTSSVNIMEKLDGNGYSYIIKYYKNYKTIAIFGNKKENLCDELKEYNVHKITYYERGANKTEYCK